MATSINFPTSPSINQTYTYGSSMWIWDGTAWKLFSSVNQYGDPVVNNLTAVTGITGNTITAISGLIISGTSSATTAALGTNTTQLATTAFVIANAKPYNYSVITSGYTATAKDGLFCDTTSGSFSVTLPASPNDNDTIFISDAKGYFDISPLTIKGNGKQIMGDSSDLILYTKNISITLIYKTNLNWRIV